jgi:hypothetical protein
MKTLRFYNCSHIGDALADSILFNALAPLPIQYMTHPRNLPHVREWFGPHVELTPYMPPGAEEIWITHTLHGGVKGADKFHPGMRAHKTPHIYNQVYFDHFRAICERHQLDFPFRTKDDICHTQPELNRPGDGEYLWDWLIVNSECLSGQLERWDEARLAEICLSLPGRVITTHPVPGLPCTRQEAPRLFDVAKVAGRSRIVAGINTGPLWACLTRQMVERAERIVTVDREHGFFYEGKSIWCRDLDEFSICLGNIRRQFSASR